MERGLIFGWLYLGSDSQRLNFWGFSFHSERIKLRTENESEEILLLTNVLASSILKYCASREKISGSSPALTSGSSPALTVRLPCTEKSL